MYPIVVNWPIRYPRPDILFPSLLKYLGDLSVVELKY